jgi:hypothetical protein
MEAWAGIEPAIELLQSSALPLGYHAFPASLGRRTKGSTDLPTRFEFQAES